MSLGHNEHNAALAEHSLCGCESCQKAQNDSSEAIDHIHNDTDTVSAAGDLPDNSGTTATIRGVGSFSSTLDSNADVDWVRVEITQEGAYQINIDAQSSSNLDTYAALLDANGNTVAINDDGPNNNTNSEIVQVLRPGTYYVAVSSYNNASSGDYTVRVSETAPPTLLEAINTGDPKPERGANDNVMTVYFPSDNESLPYNDLDGNVPFQSHGTWSNFEIQQAMAAFNVYSQYIDMEFVRTNSADGADFIMGLSHDSNQGGLGWMYFGNGGSGGYGDFNENGYGWDNQGLQQGGQGFATLLHEIGHGMSLGHPHDGGGGTRVLNGVTDAFGSYGEYQLNQGVYTIMSYNDGWQTAPMGTSGSLAYGNSGTMMALDIAALQDMYGANTTHNSGNNVYTLSDSNGSGTFYSSIWDTGGTDVIRYNGSRDANIDLRQASLRYAEGGGGWVSYADGIFGGFTIANGAIIENAIGGSGNDALTGNAFANTLRGNDGNDTLNGLGGRDTLFGNLGNDILRGGNGSDTIDGGYDNDRLYGDDGADTLLGNRGDDRLWGNTGDDNLSGGVGNDRLDGGYGNDLLYGNDGTDTLIGGRGDDKIWGNRGNDTLRGGDGRDTLDGGFNNDILFGGNGNDKLSGNLGNDQLTGGAGADTFIFKSNFDRDVIKDFQDNIDKIDLRSFDFNNRAAAMNKAVQSGDNVVFNFGDGDVLIVNNTTLAEVQNDLIV